MTRQREGGSSKNRIGSTTFRRAQTAQTVLPAARLQNSMFCKLLWPSTLQVSPQSQDGRDLTLGVTFCRQGTRYQTRPPQFLFLARSSDGHHQISAQLALLFQ